MSILNKEQLSEKFIGTHSGSENTLSSGPFHVTHNEHESFGNNLIDNDSYVIFYDGSRIIYIDGDYSISIDGDIVKADSDKFESHIILRPIELSDAKLLGDSDIDSLEELENSVYSMLLEDGLTGNETDLSQEEAVTAALPTPEDLAPDASFGITVDEEDTNVLELVKSDSNGVYIRENEAWIALDSEADEEAYPTVYGMTWYDVTPDAIPIFDDSEKEDETKKSQFDTVIVP